MKHYALTILLLIVVVAAGGFFLFRDSQAPGLLLTRPPVLFPPSARRFSICRMMAPD